MALSPRSLEITAAYQTRLAAIHQRVAADATRRYGSVNLADVRSTYDAWVPATVTGVTQAQREAVRLTAGYLEAFLSSELGGRVRGPAIQPEQYAGLSRDGRSLWEALRGPGIEIMVQLANGNPDGALAAGLTRALRGISLDTYQAARQALQDGMQADDRIEGWTRAIRGTCDACMGKADGSVLPAGTPLEIHPNCECVSEPVVNRQRAMVAARPTGQDRFDAMTEAEQDALVGPAKAKLIRDGKLTLADLVSHSPMETEPNFITGASLEEALRRANT